MARDAYPGMHAAFKPPDPGARPTPPTAIPRGDPAPRPAPVTRLARACTGWALRPPAIRQGATLGHGMHRVTADRLFQSPGARRNRAVRPRRSQWSPGAHALACTRTMAGHTPEPAHARHTPGTRPSPHTPGRPSAGTQRVGPTRGSKPCSLQATWPRARPTPPRPAVPGTWPPGTAATTAALPARGPGTWPTRQHARPVPP